jgi:hypothetical protein
VVKRAAAKPPASIRTDGHTSVRNWAILGLDLSLARTGYAVLYLEDGKPKWGDIGSYTQSNEPDSWARAQAYAIGIGMTLERIWQTRCRHKAASWGLAVVMEYPDPENSYLMGLNQVIQTSLWNPAVPYYADFAELRRMLVNAATLRSVMGIVGKTDKVLNHSIAQGFLPKGAYPNLDSDACDAVLLCRYAAWGIDLLQGRPELVPLKAQASLAKDEVKVKVKVNSKTGEVMSRSETPAGLLYNPDLWTKIDLPLTIILKRADAVAKKARLEEFTLHI